jgi:Bacteriophage T4, Gp8
MLESSPKNFRINNAEQFKESVSEPNPTNLYLTFGKTEAWPVENSPPLANTTPSAVYDVWRNMIGGKKITGNDVRHIIPRINWTSNTVYRAYDNLSENTDCYVMNSNWSVYKCISNNNGVKSNTQPTAISTTDDFVAGDGYIWKYLYSVSDFEKLKFSTSDYIPVKTLENDDGSLQWQVQNNAVSGAIHSIVLLNGGSNYSNSSNIIVSITGDGGFATATATINTVSNTVNSISILNKGSGYTKAVVSITGGGGSNASGRAIISPPGGHGKNILYELGGSSVMINGKLKGNENGGFPTVNDYRQVSLISDPRLRTSSNTYYSNSTFLQTTIVTTVGSGDYFENEIVFQGSTLVDSTFRGTVLSWDGTNSALYLINTDGTPSGSRIINGANSATARFATSFELPTLQSYSGKLLYTDNIVAVNRAPDQAEEYKIILKF